MPGSCGDLQQIGHKKSGLFSIMESNKIVNVYCDFTKPSNDSALQNWIGYADVKSLPTFFYVQKTAPFSTLGAPIPFEIERLNIGGAMNKTTGKFTAPRKGVYFFAFNGVGTLDKPGYLDVGLMVNGVQIGRAECHSTTGGEWETLTLQSTIELKTGDSVWLQILFSFGSYLQDNSDAQFNHFSGWLLQEYLSL
ncbi:vertebrate C1q and tumor necrosis factor-related protein-like protein [Daphnia pulex]|uniref:Vertebrate C1q and tumor necrosis factor-related protein-like protein n=1 Tax=Daphnia pulex TaxID=6669 RepID=E9HRT3_DAPPU|nr:vertebrate C1q and tumor necrosis factor-related protein-like protein [Daphnia pulex]|eukprot:EFX65556.1 vertebrate C1q and tumor necrosis factor-related protein-like protein [Daphnia pulex]